MGFYEEAFNVFWWRLIKMMLQMIWAIDKIENFLTKNIMDYILIGKKISDWSQVLVFKNYYSLIIITGIFIIIMILFTFTTYVYRNINNTELPFWKKSIYLLRGSSKYLLKGVLFGMIVIVLIPFSFLIVSKISLGLESGLDIMFGIKSTNASDILYNFGNTNWDGITIISVDGNYTDPQNYDDWNILLEFFGVLTITIISLKSMCNLLITLLMIFLNYCMVVFYALFWIFDDGEKMKKYIHAVTLHIAITYITNFVFYIYIILYLTLRTKLSSWTNLNQLICMIISLTVGFVTVFYVIRINKNITEFISSYIYGITYYDIWEKLKQFIKGKKKVIIKSKKSLLNEVINKNEKN